MARKLVRILLVDDHKVMRDGLRALLRAEENLTVIGEAETGEEAVELAGHLAADVIIMDLSLRGMSGLDAIRAIRRKNLPAHIVVLSMHTDNDIVLQAIKAGCDGYVPKSSAHTDLLEAIRVVQHGNRYLHPLAAATVMNELKNNDQKTLLIEMLSERERRVLQLTAFGFTSAEIGDRLMIAPKTVETYRRRVMTKLGLKRRSDLVHLALQAGLLDSGRAA